MPQFNFSEEQKNIFNYAKNGINNVIIQAVAGAGKTTTLIECVKQLIEHNKKVKILLLAHNKSTRDTLKERLGDYIQNVKVFTLHGLAYRMYMEYFGEAPNIDDDKYINYINKNINNIASESYLELNHNKKMMYKSNLFELINKSRHNLKQSEREIYKMAVRKYQIKLVSDECHLASKILKWGIENREIVDFQDLLYFPNEFGYFTKIQLSDIIMLDEAQDASLAQQDVVRRCFKRNTRLFAFGDKDQTINSWCGSDTEAFEHLKDSTVFNKPASEFPLTTNYRCGKKIIEHAKKFTKNDIKPKDNAHDGIIRYNVSLSEIKEGDMVLCRNSAPLMELYRMGVNKGLKIYFKGEEYGKTLKESVSCAYGDSIDEIIMSMKKRLISFWEFITIDSGLDFKETMFNPKILSLYDTIKTMEFIPKSITNRNELNLFIDNMFKNEGNEGIQLSTIHRAKGLEADNVFIICPSLIPSKLSQTDWEKEEEQHLLYVMCTRPKNSLNYITEKEIKPNNAYSENNSFYTELINIKREIKNEN